MSVPGISSLPDTLDTHLEKQHDSVRTSFKCATPCCGGKLASQSSLFHNYHGNFPPLSSFLPTKMIVEISHLNTGSSNMYLKSWDANFTSTHGQRLILNPGGAQNWGINMTIQLKLVVMPVLRDHFHSFTHSNN